MRAGGLDADFTLTRERCLWRKRLAYGRDKDAVGNTRFNILFACSVHFDPTALPRDSRSLHQEYDHYHQPTPSLHYTIGRCLLRVRHSRKESWPHSAFLVIVECAATWGIPGTAALACKHCMPSAVALQSPRQVEPPSHVHAGCMSACLTDTDQKRVRMFTAMH